MTLLREIQAAAADSNVDIATVLRKARILAARLHNPEFELWVDSELKGYGLLTLPPYRIIPSRAHANLRSKFGDCLPNALVFESFLPDHLKSWAREIRLNESIAEISSMAVAVREGNDFKVQWPQELAVSYGAKGYRDFECLGAWQPINPHKLVSIVNTVRNRLLDFSLRIDAENPNAGEAGFDSQPVSIEKLQPLVQNIFYGSVGNVAQNSTDFMQTAYGSFQTQDIARLVLELTTHLHELRLEAREKQRAEAQIDILKTELAGDPDAAIVRQASRTLRNILEGAIGSLLATAAQPTVWHWVRETLTALG